MGFKLIFEQEDDSAEEYPCPKCGEDVETEDNYCCNCGARLASVGKILKPKKASGMDSNNQEMD